MHRVNIARNMLLVSLRIKMWAGSRSDKEITEEVKRSKGILEKRDRYVKQLLPEEATKPITAAAMAVRTGVREYGIPFLQTGLQMIPAAELFEFREMIGERVQRFYDCVDDNVEHWEDVLARAKVLRGDDFDPTEYPTSKEYKEMNEVTIRFLPIPESSQLDVDLPEEVVEEIRQNFEDEMDELRKSVVEDLISDIREELIVLRGKVLHAARFGTYSGNKLDKLCRRAKRANLTLSKELRDLADNSKKVTAMLKPKKQCTTTELVAMIHAINEILGEPNDDDAYFRTLAET